GASAKRNGLVQFWTVLALAGLDFGELCHELAVVTIEEACHCVSLGIHAEAIDSLFRCRNPQVTHTIFHHAQRNRVEYLEALTLRDRLSQMPRSDAADSKSLQCQNRVKTTASQLARHHPL